MRRTIVFMVAGLFGAFASNVLAWDHPGHMTTAAIAYAELEEMRPELAEKIGLMMLKHPDMAPFWVAAGDARGKERGRRMFIEAARWPDDSKWTPNDRPTWHMARWAVVADDAPPEAHAAAKARGDEPAGQALDALVLNFRVLANPESSVSDKMGALSWVMHIVGDIHQPLHVSDLYSAEFPVGNAGATLSYVDDPRGDTTVPLHILWDSNVLVLTALDEVDRHAQEFRKKHPRSTFVELGAFTGPAEFELWAKESYQVAADFAYNVETVSDPNKEQDIDRLVANMVKFILEGISPVDEAPEVSPEYWEGLQLTAGRRITLAGYRIADLIIAAADQIAAHKKYVGR
jgi:hypothetical protein